MSDSRCPPWTYFAHSQLLNPPGLWTPGSMALTTNCSSCSLYVSLFKEVRHSLSAVWDLLLWRALAVISSVIVLDSYYLLDAILLISQRRLEIMLCHLENSWSAALSVAQSFLLVTNSWLLSYWKIPRNIWWDSVRLAHLHGLRLSYGFACILPIKPVNLLLVVRQHSFDRILPITFIP